MQPARGFDKKANNPVRLHIINTHEEFLCAEVLVGGDKFVFGSMIDIFYHGSILYFSF